LTPAHKELAIKLREFEGRIQEHDEQILAIFEAIRQLMTPPDQPRKKIGFESLPRTQIRGQGTKSPVWEVAEGNAETRVGQAGRGILIDPVHPAKGSLI